MLLLQGFGFDFGDLTAIIAEYLQNVIAFLVAIVSYIWNVIVFLGTYLWVALNWIAHFFYGLFLDVQKAFKWLWTNVVKGGLVKLISLFQKLRTWLSTTLKPVIDFLKKVRAWYDWMFNHFWKPLLNAIAIMRKILTIFRLLGFKWAARLDADLALVQQKILKMYTTIRGYINLAITWLDLIVDPSAILRRNPLFARLIGSANELRNLVLQAPTRPLTGSETDQQTRDRNAATLSTQKSNFTSYYAAGKVTPDDDAARTQFAAQMEQLLSGSDNYAG
jgi:hypothetical protein